MWDEPFILMRMQQTARAGQDRWDRIRDKMTEFNRVRTSEKRLLLEEVELGVCKLFLKPVRLDLTPAGSYPSLVRSTWEAAPGRRRSVHPHRGYSAAVKAFRRVVPEVQSPKNGGGPSMRS